MITSLNGNNGTVTVLAPDEALPAELPALVDVEGFWEFFRSLDWVAMRERLLKITTAHSSEGVPSEKLAERTK
jgi:hypothetical protein